MKPAALWPVAVVGALVVTVGANIAILVLANDSDKAVVEPNYYEKAVAWDSTMAQGRRNESLGWSIGATLAPSAVGARLHANLADREGAPLPGALIRVEAIHNADAARRIEGTLRDAGGGAYEADLPLRHAGLWELRFTVERDGALFTLDLRRDLAPLARGE
ncbi:MAG TPA: FixH family protein [Candidatus Eisenbacteria bacterium]|nr:FixH family protein [Candidatus Eisenbacteria bacterium]